MGYNIVSLELDLRLPPGGTLVLLEERESSKIPDLCSDTSVCRFMISWFHFFMFSDNNTCRCSENKIKKIIRIEEA